MFDQLNSLQDIDKLVASGLRESETLEYKLSPVALTPSGQTPVGTSNAISPTPWLSHNIYFTIQSLL
jgi:hypothetical protein